MSTRTAQNERRAALLLHASPPPDRAWLIGRLPESQRERLLALVAELQGLGIPPDRGLLDEVTAPSSSAPVPDERSALLQRLEQADPVRLAAVLRAEPPGLIARLLLLREWRWRPEVLQQLGEKRRSVGEHMARRGASHKTAPSSRMGLAAGAALDEQLVEALLRRLDDRRHPRAAEGEARSSTAESPRLSLPWRASRSWRDWFSPKGRRA